MPIDIVVVKTLSSYHNEWTNKYILSKCKKKNIEEYTCPKCGNWLNDEDISNYTDFNDYFLLEDMKRDRFSIVNEWFNKNYIFDVIRKSLLCDICEYEEDYSDYTLYNFKYKGKRSYTIVSYHGLYSWSSIYLIDYKNNSGYWNEYRKVLVNDNNNNYYNHIHHIHIDTEYDVYDGDDGDEDGDDGDEL
jgi:hypothetical protein